MADTPRTPAPPPISEWAQNKRFIRTFESDSKAVKSGDKAGLAHPKVVQMPVLKPAEDALTKAVANNPDSDTLDLDVPAAYGSARIGAIPEAPEARPAERLIGLPSISNIGELTEQLRPIAPPPAPPPPPPKAPVPEALEPLHTYSSDFNQATKSKGASPATILAAEQDAHVHAQVATAPRSRTNLYYGLGAVALIILGAGGAYAAYRYESRPTTVAVAPLASVRIFVDERAQIAGTGSALAQAIEQSVATPITAGSVRLLSLASGTSTSVFAALQEPAPDILLRNIDASGSLAGVVSVAAVQSPFFVLSVASYSDTFYGMLSWEPRMPSDLASFYPAYPAPPSPASVGTTTATSTAPSAPALLGFKDETVANHDARALRDSAGHTVMIYGYWDANTLIIARDEGAFSELIGRLANSRTQQ